MRIIRNAKVFSHLTGVLLALSLLPVSAQAGVGPRVQSAGGSPVFVVGSDISAGTVLLSAPDAIWPPNSPSGSATMQIEAVGTMQLGASSFTLAPVGSTGNVRWELFNTAAWDLPEETTEIPEPAPLAILGLAILGLGFYRRYRNT